MTKGQRLKYFFWNLLGWYTIKKSDRIEAYEYSLRMFQRMSPPTKNIPIGLCKVLAFATKELNPKIRGYRYSGIVYANFPELYLQKPEPAGLWWWPLDDRASRITALKNAIAIIKNEI